MDLTVQINRSKRNQRCRDEFTIKWTHPQLQASTLFVASVWSAPINISKMYLAGVPRGLVHLCTIGSKKARLITTDHQLHQRRRMFRYQMRCNYCLIFTSIISCIIILIFVALLVLELNQPIWRADKNIIRTTSGVFPERVSVGPNSVRLKPFSALDSNFNHGKNMKHANDFHQDTAVTTENKHRKNDVVSLIEVLGGNVMLNMKVSAKPPFSLGGGGGKECVTTAAFKAYVTIPTTTTAIVRTSTFKMTAPAGTTNKRARNRPMPQTVVFRVRPTVTATTATPATTAAITTFPTRILKKVIPLVILQHDGYDDYDDEDDDDDDEDDYGDEHEAEYRDDDVKPSFKQFSLLMKHRFFRENN
ncbi:hypothetical protein HELRODRAFT_164429 [Helobdella robusta]|uniref:Uncharacterized protein n=1 Tax=Helobdella robusta TaxID=6412 RepID=T1EVE7_HELRO|nr:hypothetical protein HELRODRAFT_164429 [Helobdella robusta]ESN94568.1 hypothetical protein HELRODRAFT_164429 [Helobdella robusta]